jgi:hypothetical protein
MDLGPTAKWRWQSGKNRLTGKAMAHNVICMKWGTKFGADYVNALHRMVRQHCTLAPRFFCFTDDGRGIDRDVEIRPLPQLELDAGPERGWRKLSILRKNDLVGDVLFLDLDVVIRANIDDFFHIPGKFRIVKDWDFPRAVTGNSSVFRFTGGEWDSVLQDFLRNRRAIQRRFRNEQAYLSHAIAERGALAYWPPDWCVSFKRHCLRPWPLCYFREPQEPTRAKIVVFHGKPTPMQALTGHVAKWGFRRVRPTGWLKKYTNLGKSTAELARQEHPIDRGAPQS